MVVMFSGAVVVKEMSSKRDFFLVDFVENTKESTFMMPICRKTFCGGQDLTMKVAVWKLKKYLQWKNKYRMR